MNLEQKAQDYLLAHQGDSTVSVMVGFATGETKMTKWKIANQLKPVVCDCGVEITPEVGPLDHGQNCIVRTMSTMKSEAAKELAERFHATYELLAPQFGYETREETREFDAESPNGKLMIAVCQSIIDAGYEAARPAPADDEITCDGVFHYSPTPEHCGHEGQPCPLTIASAPADEAVQKIVDRLFTTALGNRADSLVFYRNGEHLGTWWDREGIATALCTLIAAVSNEKETK